MITYRGEYPAPEFEHGTKVMVGGMRGVVQHRRHNGRNWEYGILVEGLPGINWYASLKKDPVEEQQEPSAPMCSYCGGSMGNPYGGSDLKCWDLSCPG